MFKLGTVSPMRVRIIRADPADANRSNGRWRVRVAIATLATIAVGGCATMAAHTAANFDQGSVPAQKFAKDTDACTKQAEAHGKEYGMGPYDPTHGSYNYMFDSCMQAGGYQRKAPP
jgi:hypothetical protein